MKNVIAILFLLLSLACQDKNEQIPEKFQPTIDWDLNNIDTINIYGFCLTQMIFLQ